MRSPISGTLRVRYDVQRAINLPMIEALEAPLVIAENMSGALYNGLRRKDFSSQQGR